MVAVVQPQWKQEVSSESLIAPNSIHFPYYRVSTVVEPKVAAALRLEKQQLEIINENKQDEERKNPRPSINSLRKMQTCVAGYKNNTMPIARHENDIKANLDLEPGPRQVRF